MAISDQMDLFVEQVKILGGEIAFSTSTLKRLVEQSVNDPVSSKTQVEAKNSVPRDDQSTMSRCSSNIHGSPGPGRTRKIFVGDLASTVTESDFRMYFEQFGTITDVVVMYDHNTQRSRGFGFITYVSEDAVDKVLLKTLHELNGKMVDVKCVIPKELSPGPKPKPTWWI